MLHQHLKMSFLCFAILKFLVEKCSLVMFSFIAILLFLFSIILHTISQCDIYIFCFMSLIILLWTIRQIIWRSREEKKRMSSVPIMHRVRLNFQLSASCHNSNSIWFRCLFMINLDLKILYLKMTMNLPYIYSLYFCYCFFLNSFQLNLLHTFNCKSIKCLHHILNGIPE